MPAFHRDKSTLLSVLDWLNKPEQGILNLARGNAGGALRNAFDFFADPIDAALPGDVIPEMSRPEDTARLSDMLGIDRDAHPIGASLTDAASAVFNPLTYLSFGANKGIQVLGKTIAGAGQTLDPLTVAGGFIRKGIDKLPGSVADPINGAIQGTRETLNWLNPDAGVDDLIARSNALGSRVARAKKPVIADMFDGVDPEDSKRAFRLINNYDRPEGGAAVQLGPDSGGRLGTWEEQQSLLQQRLANAPWSEEQKAKALDLAAKALQHQRMNFQEAVQDFPGMHASLVEGQSIDTHAPLDYAQRHFDFGDQDEIAGFSARPGTLRGRKLDTTDKLLGVLNDERGGDVLNEDLRYVTAARDASQGSIAKKGQLGYELINRGLTGDFGENVQGAVKQALEKRGIEGFQSLSDPASAGAVDDVIATLEKTSPDDARVLKTAWAGLAPRGKFMQGVANLNKLFKPAAVYGLGWPGKVAATARNVLAFGSQLAAEEDLGFGAAAKQVMRTPQNLGHAFAASTDQALGTSLSRGVVHENQAAIDNAYLHAGGRDRNAMEALHTSGRDDLIAALKHGVFDSGFATAETLGGVESSGVLSKAMNAVGLGPKGQGRVRDYLEAPGTGFQAAEDFGRSNAFFDARERLGDAGAAAAVRRGLYNYDTVSEGQRTLSDLIPFAKFTTSAIRQNANFISRVPGVGTTLAGVYGGDDDEPLYPYLEEQAHIKIGKDEKGNNEYVAGLGLPIESLNQVPNLTGESSVRGLGRDLERIIGGSSQPLLKSAYSLFSGHDPFFDTPFMSYDKVLGHHAGAFGRDYNAISNTGLIQPLETPMNTIGKILDDRHSFGDKALDLLTGANVVSVDPNLALQQQLTKALEASPDVRQSRNLYSTDDTDADTVALLKELAHLKNAARKARRHVP